MMMFTKKSAMVAVLGLSLSACANIYDNAKNAAPTGDAYNQALFSELMALADSERRQEDWTDANYYGAKALMVANGGGVQPVELGARSLDEPFLSELSAARPALVAALGDGATANPAAAASAFAGFECWAEQAEEGHQADDIAGCKAKYEAAMAELAGGGDAMPMMAGGPWAVFFPTNGDTVDFDGQKAVSAAADAANASPDAAVVVIGHTDSVGSEEYNLDLSKRRAQAVVEILNLLGVSTDRMTIGAVGEGELPVETADGVAEQANRVVNMRVIK